jgi:predicted ATPase
MGCLLFAVFDLWFLGYPDQALQRSHEALALAQELAHPFSLAFALAGAAWLHQYRRENQAAQEWAEAVITLTTEQGFALWLARGAIWRGWALAEKGQAEEGITQMRQGLATGRVIGDELTRTYHLALLAKAHGKAGQTEEGMKVLAEALATVDGIGERFYEAELYRLKGQLTLQQNRERATGNGERGTGKKY